MHWRNSQFQVVHFLAGKCHTADGAYRMLQELREERHVAIRSAEAAAKRHEAKEARLDEAISSGVRSAALDAEAELLELKASSEQAAACYAEALRERDFIDQLIAVVQPHRQYAHLPDHEAHQACQRDEWRLELMQRAENYLLTQGFIPADHYETMRLHPDWVEIQAHIAETRNLVAAGVTPERIVGPLRQIAGLLDPPNAETLVLTQAP